MYYYCDPTLNTKCSKKHCHKKGGPCEITQNLAFAKQPVKVCLLIVDKEDFIGVLPDDK